MSNNLKYRDITEKIIGAAFEVHTFLGNGFQEVIYQRGLAFELALLWYEHSAPSYIKIVKPNYESTIRWYRDIRCSYHYLDLYYRMGKACHRIGRYQEAVKAYHKAIDLQIAIVDAYNEACFETETQAVDIKEENKRQHFLQCFMPEPPEYPEWWTDVFQNRDSACCHRPLRDAEIKQ